MIYYIVGIMIVALIVSATMEICRYRRIPDLRSDEVNKSEKLHGFVEDSKYEKLAYIPLSDNMYGVTCVGRKEDRWYDACIYDGRCEWLCGVGFEVQPLRNVITTDGILHIHTSENPKYGRTVSVLITLNMSEVYNDDTVIENIAHGLVHLIWLYFSKSGIVLFNSYIAISKHQRIKVLDVKGMSRFIKDILYKDVYPYRDAINKTPKTNTNTKSIFKNCTGPTAEDINALWEPYKEHDGSIKFPIFAQCTSWIPIYSEDVSILCSAAAFLRYCMYGSGKDPWFIKNVVYRETIADTPHLTMNIAMSYSGHADVCWLSTTDSNKIVFAIIAKTYTSEILKIPCYVNSTLGRELDTHNRIELSVRKPYIPNASPMSTTMLVNSFDLISDIGNPENTIYAGLTKHDVLHAAIQLIRLYLHQYYSLAIISGCNTDIAIDSCGRWTSVNLVNNAIFDLLDKNITV